MLTPGDVVEVNLGTPTGSEAGLLRPAVVVTAARILRDDRDRPVLRGAPAAACVVALAMATTRSPYICRTLAL